MALTVPSVADLDEWKGEESATDLEDRVLYLLIVATDMLEIATGLHEDPTDVLGQRIIRRGILDMTWYLGTSMEDRDASFSAFSSERIGSYSYSKMTRAVRLGEETGVPFFDMAVAFYGDLDTGDQTGVSWASSEQVMPATLALSISPQDEDTTITIFGD